MINALKVSAVALLLSSASANAFDLPFFSNSKGHVKIFAVDITPSSSGADDLKKICQPSFSAFLKTIQSGDEVSLLVITDRNASKSNFLTTVMINKTGRSYDDQQELILKKKQLRDSYRDRAVLNMQSTNGSNILDAIVFSTDKLNAQESKKKSLYICSDGIENSKYGDFDNHKFEPEKVLRSVPSALKPKMTGVDVYWFGLGGADANQLGKINQFWKGYLTNNGATIKQMSRATLTQ